MNTPLLFALFAILFCCVLAETNLTRAEKQHQCEVGASAKKRIGKVQSEIQKAVASLKKVVKEFMDIPRVLVTETMQEGVGLIQNSMESVGEEIKTQIKAITNPQL
uniref:SXP/RAL-2 family protein Ani s 5-like cation-binding domain-containing protein n=1 Tax=Pristionchus pacificus TaxID=54126 RepID=A0A8R1V398_PRIPA